MTGAANNADSGPKAVMTPLPNSIWAKPAAGISTTSPFFSASPAATGKMLASRIKRGFPSTMVTMPTS